MTTKWTVKPFYTPHEDSDPLGVFEIKEVKAEAEKWEDASMDAALNSEQEQHAIDRRGEVTEQAARLIAAHLWPWPAPRMAAHTRSSAARA